MPGGIKMNLKQLEAFICVAETKSFSKAAKKLYLTQPTVSAHVQSLETELGRRLFLRTTKDVLLSPAGERLYEPARQMLQLERQIKKEFQDEDSGQAKMISVGASTVPGQYILPQILTLFSRTYPGYRLNLMEDDSMGVVRKVMDGQIEVGFTGTRTEDDTCVFESFYKDELVVVTPVGEVYDQYQEHGFPLEQLRKERFIIREEGSGTRKEMEQYLSEAGICLEDLDVAAAMSSQETIKKSVRNGMGISIMSSVSVEDYVRQGLVKRIPVRGKKLERNLYMVWSKSNKPGTAAKVFIQFVRDLYTHL